MPYRFDQIIDRSQSHSTKWEKYAGRDILPFWVADMDFAAPEFILEPLRERLEHPMLGYTERPASLSEAFRSWLAHHFRWQVPTEWLVWLPGVVPGINMAVRTLAADSRLLIPTPIYYPFLGLAENAGLDHRLVPLQLSDGVWKMDMDAMAQAVDARVRMVCIANPQNPTGRVYSLKELEALAEFIERHDLILVSDEIHCSLVLDPKVQHLPIASAVPDIAERTISLFAATKTYNIPALGCAVAVIPNAELRKRFIGTRADLVASPGPLAYIASEAAFNDRSSWVPELIVQLRKNLAELRQVAGHKMSHLEATYLAWLDIRDLQLNDVPGHFESHGLGLSNGAQFGCEGFVRFNFAAPPDLLAQGLERLSRALEKK